MSQLAADNATVLGTPRPFSEREYPLSDAEFERIRKIVREHTGISLAEAKRELVYGRLSRRLRKLNLPSFSAYLELLENGDDAEMEQFTNAITTNLTAFFREDHHFEYLTSTILPMLLKRNAASRRIRIWSAGCSTGEEPYSIAMTLAESASEFRGWDVKILATDLDSNVVAHGKAGVYSADRFEKMHAARRDKYFSAAREAGKFSAREEIRSYISFRQLNLMHQWPFKGPFDVIFCRNVVIYFDKPTQRELFARMAAMQTIGDHLIIGHSESLYRVCESYRLIGKTIYRREGE